MAVASNFLGDIKVSRKLGTGFGILLLAVLAVAFIGYNSNSVLVDRLSTTRLIGTLNDATQDMRLSEKQYEAAADAAFADSYNAQLNVLQGLVSKALDTLTRAENQQASEGFASHDCCLRPEGQAADRCRSSRPPMP